jgi:two-component system, NarL family, sensor kinase
MNEARRQVVFIASRVVEPELTSGLLVGDPSALSDFDGHVRESVLRPGVLQVRLRSGDGTILYSDAAELIGRRFEIEQEKRSLLDAGRGSSAVSGELDGGDHTGLRAGLPFIAISAVIDGPGGEQLLWESYVEPQELVEQAGSLLQSIAFAGAAAASLVLAAQVVVAFVLARELGRSRETRISLMQRAAFAADDERRRIASDLHDGVIQDLHGLAFDLHALGDPRSASLGPSTPETHHLAARLRQSVHELRTLAAAIHPPDLHGSGLEEAYERLRQSCDGQVDATFVVDSQAHLTTDTRRLVFRTTQEAVRNVLAHAHASHLLVQVRVADGSVSLTVEDDGWGFVGRPAGVSDGHLGLTLIREMAEGAGGRLTVRSAPGSGTCLHVEVPA